MKMLVVSLWMQIKLLPFRRWKRKKSPLSAYLCIIVAIFLNGAVLESVMG